MKVTTLPKFWTRVEIPSERECWPWRGKIDSAVSGRFKTVFNKAQIHHAHVFSLAMATQETPNGRFAIHSCDNPPCVNPLHLRWGDHRQNMRDMSERGRSTRGERGSQARLTEQQVREIYARWVSDERVLDLASEFGVCRQTVSNIIAGTTWAHLNLLSADARRRTTTEEETV